MKYCKTCLRTDTRRNIIFNDEGIYFHANALSKIKVFKKTHQKKIGYRLTFFAD